VIMGKSNYCISDIMTTGFSFESSPITLPSGYLSPPGAAVGPVSCGSRPRVYRMYRVCRGRPGFRSHCYLH
ncbi:hypothetical protein L9F63_009238, partial [Diploptera punctata]